MTYQEAQEKMKLGHPVRRNWWFGVYLYINNGKETFYNYCGIRKNNEPQKIGDDDSFQLKEEDKIATDWEIYKKITVLTPY